MLLKASTMVPPFLLDVAIATAECYHDSDPLTGQTGSDITRHISVLSNEEFGNTHADDRPMHL